MFHGRVRGRMRVVNRSLNYADFPLLCFVEFLEFLTPSGFVHFSRILSGQTVGGNCSAAARSRRAQQHGANCAELAPRQTGQQRQRHQFGVPEQQSALLGHLPLLLQSTLQPGFPERSHDGHRLPPPPPQPQLHRLLRSHIDRRLAPFE